MKTRKAVFLGILCALACARPPLFASPGILPEAQERALIREVSGIRAKDYITRITAYDRTATPGFQAALRMILRELQEFGLDAGIESYDGDPAKMHYAPKKVRWWPPFGWRVRKAQLWIENDEKLADYEELPIVLARYSRSARVIAEAVYAGTGTRDEEYAGLDVSGKIVVATGYAPPVLEQAVMKRSAAGIVIVGASSYSTTKGLDYPTMVVWQVLNPEPRIAGRPSYAFSLSQKSGDRLIRMIQAGSKPRLRVEIDADVFRVNQEVLTATIPGSEGREEILFTAHLDHPKPSANDNASGSGMLIELARCLETLRREGVFKPRRTIRFLWVTEGPGTFGYIQSHPNIAKQVIGALNLDMVGEETSVTHSVMQISRTPDSLPSFLNDIVSELVARTDALDLNSPLGSRQFVNYRIVGASPSSDHYLLNDGGVRVPAILISHHPDDFHHASMDTPDKLDPSTLNRVGFIAGGAAMLLSEADASYVPALAAAVFSHAQDRIAGVMRQAGLRLAREPAPATYELCRIKLRALAAREKATIESLRRLGTNAAVEQHLAVLVSQVAVLEQVNHQAVVALYTASAGRRPEERSLTAAEQRLAAIVPRTRPPFLHNQWERLLELATLPDDDRQWLQSFRQRLDLSYMRLPELINFIDTRRNLLEIMNAVNVEAFLWNASVGPMTGFFDELNTPYKPAQAADVERFFRILQKAGLVEW